MLIVQPHACDGRLVRFLVRHGFKAAVATKGAVREERALRGQVGRILLSGWERLCELSVTVTPLKIMADSLNRKYPVSAAGAAIIRPHG